MLATVEDIFHQVRGSVSSPCVPVPGIVSADESFCDIHFASSSWVLCMSMLYAICYRCYTCG